jgi:outer membrane protein insertion porin family
MVRSYVQARRIAGMAALYLVCAAPGIVCAQSQSEPAKAGGSAKVVSIKVSGSKKFSSAEVSVASGIQPGGMVTREDIQGGADRLSALGWFNNVQYKFNTARDGVQVEFTLEDAPVVPVAFDNFPWFTDQELAQSIRSDTGLFDGTAPEGGSALESMKQSLQKLLARRGIRGEVETSLVAAPGETGSVQRFHVNGPSIKVNTVEFSDPLARGDVHVTERLSDIVGKPYSRFTLDLFAYEQLRPLYLSRGYVRVAFAAPEVRFAGDPRQSLPDAVSVRLVITPAKQYRWGGAAWTGNNAFDAASLDRMTTLAVGDAADGNKIQAAWLRVESEYGKRGYLEAKVNPQPVFAEAQATVSYRVNISEGPQYRVGQIVITGLSLAAERQLLAAWSLPRGEIFNRQYYEDFVAQGARKIFENSAVHFETMGHLLQPHPETRVVDILLDFQ